MIKRSFLGLVKPRFEYNLAPDPVQDVPLPKTVTLLLKAGQNGGGGNGPQGGRPGENRPETCVITGQC